MTQSEPLTTADVARLYQCSVRTIHRMVKAGQLTPTQKFPGATGGYLFDRAEVERLAADQRGAA